MYARSFCAGDTPSDVRDLYTHRNCDAIPALRLPCKTRRLRRQLYGGAPLGIRFRAPRNVFSFFVRYIRFRARRGRVMVLPIRNVMTWEILYLPLPSRSCDFRKPWTPPLAVEFDSLRRFLFCYMFTSFHIFCLSFWRSHLVA